MEATPWLCFEVSGQDYAIPLASVVEVTGAQRPHLIPRIPLEIISVTRCTEWILPSKLSTRWPACSMRSNRICILACDKRETSTPAVAR